MPQVIVRAEVLAGACVPFEIEKQTALLSVLHTLTDGSSPIAALDVTQPGTGLPTTTAFPTARWVTAAL